VLWLTITGSIVVPVATHLHLRFYADAAKLFVLSAPDSSIFYLALKKRVEA